MPRVNTQAYETCTNYWSSSRWEPWYEPFRFPCVRCCVLSVCVWTYVSNVLRVCNSTHSGLDFWEGRNLAKIQLKCHPLCLRIAFNGDQLIYILYHIYNTVTRTKSTLWNLINGIFHNCLCISQLLPLFKKDNKVAWSCFVVEINKGNSGFLEFNLY
jgi:hypothetical protein